MSDKPSVSVVLTAYNRGRAMPRTLDSILNQTYTDFELIITDDCSTDDTPQICREYVRLDSRVRYYRNETNLGMPGNLNAGIRRARGDYVANLHDGDVFRWDLLEKWRSALDRIPSAGLAFCYRETLDAEGRPTGVMHIDYDSELIPGKTLIRDIIRKTSSPVWGTVMVRAEAYGVLGLFDERFGFISDVDMWMRIAAHYDVVCVMEPLIGLFPKEPTHPWNQRRWEAAFWNEDLLCTNIERVFGPPNGPNHDIWREFFRTWDRKVIRWLLGDIYHGRWDALKSGLERLHASRSGRLAILGSAVKKLLFQSNGSSAGPSEEK
jgi:glycosyltransferase involved in cell wall biosynthesis